MKVVEKQLKELRMYENNPRNNDQAVDEVAKSIQEFGFKVPMVIDANNVIVCGHTRYKACLKLGIDSVPCVVADDLSPEQIKAFRLVENKTSEVATWDFDKLNEELNLIQMDMGEFDFDVPNLSESVIEDDYGEEQEVEPRAKLGDLYQLGNHRLICGDSTDASVIDRLMDGKKADMVFTDPPYNVNIAEKKKKILHSNEYNELMNDDMPMEEFEEFLRLAFTNINAYLKDEGSYYIFSCQGGDSEMMMMMMMRECGIKCRHQIIWVKDAPVFSMGRLDYDYKHEPILYGWKSSHHFYRKGEQDKSVWEFKRTANKLHPTMKPVELIANALNNSSKKEDIVMDLFGGSGSTLIACEQLERSCYMSELDPHYCDVIINRWETFTGKKAVKL